MRNRGQVSDDRGSERSEDNVAWAAWALGDWRQTDWRTIVMRQMPDA